MRFEAESALPITTIAVDLEGDGEPAKHFTVPVEAGNDGRFWRAVAYKPGINGTWPLIVTATDQAGNVGIARCGHPGVTVAF